MTSDDGGPSRASRPLAAPGEEEIALLRLLAEGATDAVVMNRLGLGRRTFERRLRGAMERLGARSRFQAGFLFARSGEAEAPPEA